MEKRYRVVRGSQSGHGGCFKATVVDTTKPVMVAGERWDDEYLAVCECFELSDAERICRGLNAAYLGSPRND